MLWTSWWDQGVLTRWCLHHFQSDKYYYYEWNKSFLIWAHAIFLGGTCIKRPRPIAYHPFQKVCVLVYVYVRCSIKRLSSGFWWKCRRIIFLYQELFLSVFLIQNTANGLREELGTTTINTSNIRFYMTSPLFYVVSVVGVMSRVPIPGQRLGKH